MADSMARHTGMSALEICAGAGGQALGLEMAGFHTEAAFEIDRDACATLRLNRSEWTVVEGDIKSVDATKFKGIDLFAGGVPCPPFSIAGKQLGKDDERDLFPAALRMIEECKPAAVMLENVRGLASSRFDGYRAKIIKRLLKLGYDSQWRVILSSDYGVPQLRPRFVLVAMRPKYFANFRFPLPLERQLSVGEAIGDIMGSKGWKGVDRWVKKAGGVAPTLVGGSKKHGGADLGPTRAKRQWAELGVDGHGIANEPPSARDPIKHLPRLTIGMVSRIQGFPDSWSFSGKKTSQYRQIGNAFPPPVASAVGRSILNALNGVVVSKAGDQLNIEFAA